MSQNNNYFQRFIAHLKRSYKLLKHPTQWQALQTEAFSAKAIYVNLVLPLALLAELPHTLFTIINGDITFAFVILIPRIAVFMALIILCVFILNLVSKISQNHEHTDKIFTALPYCFVPFFISKFLSAAIINFAPLLLLGFQWVLPLAGLILTIYMVAGFLSNLLNYSYEHKVLAVALISILLLLFWWNLFSIQEWIISTISPYIA